MPEYKETVCRLCSACCPVVAEVDGGRLIGAKRKVRPGQAEAPACPKLAAAPEIIYAPERLRTPLIRRSRQREEFQEASWDEALDYIAERLLALREAYGAESVAWLRGMAADWGVPWDYANRLMNSFGSPNAIGNGSVCHVGREMANVYTCGAMTTAQPEKSACIMIWGKNDLNTSPAVGEAVLAARKRGAKLIVVDPVRTRLARLADIWLQVKPGHDGLLAMAMMNEIISRNLYDDDFVSRYTIGFDELKKAAAAFPAGKVAAHAWLEAEAVREAARLYAKTKPACLIEGNGLDMQVEAFQTTRAVSFLRALTGNLDRPGGDLLPQPVPLRNIQRREALSPNVLPVTGNYELFDTFHETWGRHAQSSLIDAIVDENPYPVRGLVVQSGNPAVTMTDSHRVQKALGKLEFMVAIDLFHTRTTAFADVVLPAASCFEETQLNRAFTRNNPVRLQNKVVDSPGDSWPDWKIVFQLAARLGLQQEFPWKTVEEALDYQLEPSGLTVDVLRRHPEGVRVEPLEYEKYHRDGFATPSGKVEFFSSRLLAGNFEPVPFANGRWPDPLGSAEGDGGEGEVKVGISGARVKVFTHTQFRQIASLRQQEKDAAVEMSPLDAERQHIQAGDWLEVSTGRGKVRMKARISAAVHPGSILIAWGWGEIDDAFSINNLTDDSRRDPVIGAPANRGFYCRVKKLNMPEGP